jgi:hypothetical protein
MGFLPQSFYKYERLARDEGGDVEENRPRDRRKSWTTAYLLVIVFVFALAGIAYRR